MTELWALGAASVAQKIRQQEVTAVAVTEAALQRMDSVNPILNAVVDDCRDSALATAKDLDKRIKAGEKLGPMAGVPVTVKVNLDQKGHATTNGLQLQKDLIAPSNSPVVDNLAAAGAIIIGRTNTPAFSMRWFTRNSLHGHTLNPVNQALTPGGSSGGAASAAAAGIGALAHGTDIAGSIRYPAYACGIHGLRPTLGRVPVHNETVPDRLLAGQLMAVSGPLARSIDDLALGFAVMSGGFEQANTLASARDPWWVPAPLDLPTPAKRAALCLNPDNLEVDPELIKAMQVAAQKLTDDGWEVVETDCPPLAEAANLNLLLWMLEMEPAAAIVQQEGDADAIFVYQQLLESRRDVEKLSAAEIMQRRSALTREWQLFLHQYPVLICPPCGELPFADLLDVESPSSFARVLEAQMPQVGLPLMGIPGLCVTTGFSGNGPTRIPVGLQLVAGRFREDLLLQAGKLLETVITPATPEGVA